MKVDFENSGQDTGDLVHMQLTNLSSALAALQADSPALAAKLAELYDVVGSGHYEIDPHALIGSIIRDASGPTASITESPGA